MTEMTEREAFEQMCAISCPDLSMARHPDDNSVYLHPATGWAWAGYKAGIDAAKTEAIWEGDLNELSRIGQEMGEYDAGTR